MKKGRKLPLPPPIDAITRLDDLEDLAEAFYLANGYSPELVSHWDPKPEFALEIEKWLVRETRPSSLIQYVYADRDFVLDLLIKIAAAADHKQLAKTIVVELARFYEFQSVSIFKINAWSGHFSLLAQQTGPQGGAEIPSGYKQPLNEGLLGLTYERGETINLKDRDDESEAAKRFKKVAPDTRSELCIPIKLRGRILWILNLEDSRKNAFAEPEVEKIESIVKQVDATVDHLFQGLVLSQVLKVFPDGVVIARIEGEVLLCNEEAQRLFELETEPSGAYTNRNRVRRGPAKTYRGRMRGDFHATATSNRPRGAIHPPETKTMLTGGGGSMPWRIIVASNQADQLAELKKGAAQIEANIPSRDSGSLIYEATSVEEVKQFRGNTP